jgi:prevent-host-death family protein
MKAANLMEKMIGAFEARRQLGKILKAVAGKGDSYVVEYHGEPVAAVVPIELYEQWKRRREAFFENMRQAAERANLSEEEAEKLVTEAVQAVRAQQP